MGFIGYLEVVPALPEAGERVIVFCSREPVESEEHTLAKCDEGAGVSCSVPVHLGEIIGKGVTDSS